MGWRIFKVRTFRVQNVTLLEIFNLETLILLLKPLFYFWIFFLKIWNILFYFWMLLFYFGIFYRLVGLWKLWRLLASLDQKIHFISVWNSSSKITLKSLACLRFAILTLCSCWVMPTWATNKTISKPLT